jgi:hypothetical protein
MCTPDQHGPLKPRPWRSLFFSLLFQYVHVCYSSATLPLTSLPYSMTWYSLSNSEMRVAAVPCSITALDSVGSTHPSCMAVITHTSE